MPSLLTQQQEKQQQWLEVTQLGPPVAEAAHTFLEVPGH